MCIHLKTTQRREPELACELRNSSEHGGSSLSSRSTSSVLAFEHLWCNSECRAGRIFRRPDGYYATVVDAAGEQQEWYGPFPTLCDALPAFNNNAVTRNSVAIRCPDVDAESLLPMLSVYAADHPGLTLNGRSYQVRQHRLVATGRAASVGVAS